jgi:hypothetical protein
MNKSELKIIINKSISEVFDFTINPENTPKWLDSIKEEKIDTDIIGVGTKYQNTGDGKNWSEYICTEYKKYELFELAEVGGHYRVKYFYKKISESETELTYLEFIDDGVSYLQNPLNIKSLEMLKSVME